MVATDFQYSTPWERPSAKFTRDDREFRRHGFQPDGMISIPEGHGQWVLRPFPRCRSFTALLEKSKFVMPASVRADGGSSSLLKPVAEGAYWKLPLKGAKSYSWPVAN